MKQKTFEKAAKLNCIIEDISKVLSRFDRLKTNVQDGETLYIGCCGDYIRIPDNVCDAITTLAEAEHRKQHDSMQAEFEALQDEGD